MSCVIFLTFWTNFVSTFTASWISANSTLPTPNFQLAVGSYNNTLYLFGGTSNPQQIIQYDIDSATYVQFNTRLPATIQSSAQSQFWTQSQNTVYMIQSGTYFLTFNISTLSANISIELPQSVGTSSCVTSSDIYGSLYVIGGDNGANEYINTLQVLNLLTNTWVDAEPMNESRGYHVCAAAPGGTTYLWAIGGLPSNDIYLSTIERVSLIDIQSKSWFYNSESLAEPVYMARAVSYEQYIYVIGGSSANEIVLNTMQIIDTSNGKVILSTDTLPYDIITPGSICHNGIIYLFGGLSASDTALDTMIYYTITSNDVYTTMNPTSVTVSITESTINPTTTPLFEPTIPSFLPSIALTEQPLSTLVSGTIVPETEVVTDIRQNDNDSDDTDMNGIGLFSDLTENMKRVIVLTLAVSVLCCIILGLCFYQLMRYITVMAAVKNNKLEIIQMHQVHELDMNEIEKLQLALALSLTDVNETNDTEYLQVDDGVPMAIANVSDTDDGLDIVNTNDIVDDYKQDVDDEGDGTLDTGYVDTDRDSDDDVLTGYNAFPFVTLGNTGETNRKDTEHLI